MMSPSILGLAALIGASAYLALYHTGLWLARRRDQLHLWIAAWCLATIVLQTGRLLHYAAISPEQAVLGLRLTVASAFPLGWMLVEICHRIAQRPARRLPRFGLLATSLGLAAVALFTPWLATDSTRPWADGLGQTYLWVDPGPLFPLLGVYAVVLMVYGFVQIHRSGQLEPFTQRLFLAGCAVYAAVGANDMAIAVGVRSVTLFEYGFAALALVFTYITLRQFHQLHWNLEEEVSARTSQLREALARARAAAAAKSRFLANMSHELRTPMNGVLGTLELLRDTPLDDQQLRLARLATTSAESLLHLLDEILDLARIEAGRIHLERTDFDLRALVRGVVAAERKRVVGRPMELCCRFAETVPSRVTGDPQRLRQVLEILVGNATKFAEKGDISISLRVLGQADGRMRIRVDVSDNGPGIAPDRREDLFEPFVQADDSAARRHGGAGLGLSIARQLVDLMGGEIGLESEVGQGSTFWFSVWLGSATQPEATADPALHQPSAPEPRADSPNVLVVDDNELSRVVAAGMLSALGCRVEVMASGRLALEVLEQERRDLVLMNCELPDLDGYEATRRIRASEQQRGAESRTPVVGITTDAAPCDLERCAAAGMDDCIDRPFSVEALDAILDRWAPSDPGTDPEAR